MATFENTVNDTSITTSLGGLAGIAAGDTVSFIKFSIAYASGGDLSGTDLLLVQINQGCECSFENAAGGYLKLTCNRTSTGQFINRGSRRADLFSTSSAGVIWKIQHHGSAPLYLNTLKCAGGLWCVGAGRVYINGDVDVTTILVESTGRCTYYKTTGGFQATTITNFGDILIQNDFGTLNQVGGVATIDDVSVTPVTVTVTGGTLKMKDCGAIGAMSLKNCTIDWYDMKHDISVGGTTAVGPGVTIIYKKGGIQPTWTLSNDAGAPKIVTLD